MSRFFNNKEIELLAPAGTFEIFEKVIQSGADAVYFGGKILNMRMHRKNYNLTNEEIEKAISIAHSLNKKVYITVNNLFSKKDLNDAKEYFKFLEKVKPDGLIIQDFSIIEIFKELNINIPLHSSVMMNVHNVETINRLKELGITRVVASRDMDLKTINALKNETHMEFEYFTHGDMCVAHGAQCLYSGLLFGKSSNRGLCMKPCRWNFSIKKDGNVYDTEYPLAVKDMYMYEHLPEMIDAGITSFKIEGRMRDSDYLIKLINYYADSLDRYISDPLSYDRKKHSKYIYDTRKRDLSTAYAFGKPGLKNINRRYEGTGKFYSTGKVFSNPIEEIDICEDRINKIKNTLKTEDAIPKSPTLTVRVNNYEQAKVAIDMEVDEIYLSGEVFEPYKPFTKEEIISLTSIKGSSKIYLALPRMMDDKDFHIYEHLLNTNNLNIDGLLVTNLGAIRKFKSLGYELIGDYSLNIYNEKASSFYKKEGLSVGTLSVEAPLSDAIDTIKNSPLPIELIVHGSPIVMYLEHDLYENTLVYEPIKKENNKHVSNNILVLVDDKGFEHPVYRDSNGRNHFGLYKDISYLSLLEDFNRLGINRFRIEGSHYDMDTFKKVLKIYKNALNDLSNCDKYFMELKEFPMTLGAFQFD